MNSNIERIQELRREIVKAQKELTSAGYWIEYIEGEANTIQEQIEFIQQHTLKGLEKELQNPELTDTTNKRFEKIVLGINDKTLKVWDCSFKLTTVPVDLVRKSEGKKQIKDLQGEELTDFIINGGAERLERTRQEIQASKEISLDFPPKYYVEILEFFKQLCLRDKPEAERLQLFYSDRIVQLNQEINDILKGKVKPVVEQEQEPKRKSFFRRLFS